MDRLTVEIKGMTCAMCVRHVREALEGLAGVEEAKVDLQGRNAAVRYDASKVTLEQMRQAVEEAGYELV